MRSRSTFPPGAWTFVEAATGYVTRDGLTFDQTVDEIIAHRKKNPRFNLSTNRETVEQQLDKYTASRLARIPGAEVYIQQETGASIPFEQAPLQAGRLGGGLAAGLAAIRKVSVGVPVLLSWLGSGLKPVDQVKAEGRAVVCAGCPKNSPEGWFDWWTGQIAAMVKDTMEIKAKLKLNTSRDQDIHVCTACRCHLETKVWTPLEHIADNLSEKARSELNTADPRCWILSELEETEKVGTV